MAAPLPPHADRIAELFRELGISEDYGIRRHLEPQTEASELISIGNDDAGRDCLLAPRAARAWRIMRERALVYGIKLVPLSGYRSIERQAEIIRGKLALGENLDDVLRSMAAPGYSEHHSGRAIDIGTDGILPLEEAFATSSAYAWLTRHGDHFGFRLSYPRNNRAGLVYEPWHWYWQG